METLPCPGRFCISGMCIYPEMGLQWGLVPFSGMSSTGTLLGTERETAEELRNQCCHPLSAFSASAELTSAWGSLQAVQALELRLDLDLLPAGLPKNP